MALTERISQATARPRGRWAAPAQARGIAKGLAKDATLAAKFAMFNALNRAAASGANRAPAVAVAAAAFGGADIPRPPGARPAGTGRAGDRSLRAVVDRGDAAGHVARC